MSSIFLPGPFAEADMLRAILGPDGAGGPLRAARAPGHALFVDPQGAALALAAEAGAVTDGAVAEVDAAAAARLAFAFAAFGAAGAPTPVVLEDGRRGEAFLAGPGRAPAVRFEAIHQPEWRAHLAEAALEAMGQFGRRPAAEMAALMPGISFRALSRVRGAVEASPVRVRRGLSAVDVEPVAIARPYAKYFAIEEHRLRHRRFDGRMSGVVERAVFASGDAVTVLPFDPRRRAVLLIEQFRVGPFARRDPHPWCLETVAGRCDAGEGPEATARREALEEAGLTLGRIERIAGYYTSPGVMAEHITAYVGEADLEGAGGVHGLAEEDEDIRALVLPLDAALELVRSGEVNNGPLLISLLWLAGNADRLAAAWSRS